MHNKKEIRYLPARELRVAKADDGSRTVSGYAAVFNAMSVDMGGWREIIAPGCFTKSLLSDPDVMCLRDHDTKILLGRTTSKTLILSEDTTGLKFECLLPDTTQANDLAALLERGDITGCSFGFICRMDNWTHTEDGLALRMLIDVDLFDVSIVSEPAYPDTSVSVRSAPAEIRSLIEDWKKSKRDDDGDNVETDSTVACTCECDPCQLSNCDGCLIDDCDCETCSCPTATGKYRNRAHMILELARLRAR